MTGCPGDVFGRFLWSHRPMVASYDPLKIGFLSFLVHFWDWGTCQQPKWPEKWFIKVGDPPKQKVHTICSNFHIHTFLTRAHPTEPPCGQNGGFHHTKMSPKCTFCGQGQGGDSWSPFPNGPHHQTNSGDGWDHWVTTRRPCTLLTPNLGEKMPFWHENK